MRWLQARPPRRLMVSALPGELEVSPGGPPDDGSLGFALSGSQPSVSRSMENAALRSCQ
jgi:hypothetical protein